MKNNDITINISVFIDGEEIKKNKPKEDDTSRAVRIEKDLNELREPIVWKERFLNSGNGARHRVLQTFLQDCKNQEVVLSEYKLSKINQLILGE